MSVKIEQGNINSHNDSKDIRRHEKNPDLEDLKKFSALMEKASDEQKSNAFEKSSSDLSSIFSQLLSGKNSTEITDNPKIIDNQALKTDELQKLSDSLVSRILVSDKNLSGAEEVRLLLNDSAILKQTEISIRRDLSGMLFVAISSSDNNSYQKLLSTKAILEKQLNNVEKNAVRVDIVYNSEHSSENNAYDSKTFEDK